MGPEYRVTELVTRQDGSLVIPDVTLNDEDHITIALRLNGNCLSLAGGQLSQRVSEEADDGFFYVAHYSPTQQVVHRSALEPKTGHVALCGHEAHDTGTPWEIMTRTLEQLRYGGTYPRMTLCLGCEEQMRVQRNYRSNGVVGDGSADDTAAIARADSHWAAKAQDAKQL